jgi:hypothetical protein
MVDLSLFFSGLSENGGTTANGGTSIEQLGGELKAKITIPHDGSLTLDSATCGSLSGNEWNYIDGCSIFAITESTVTIETTHFSYFTVSGQLLETPSAPDDDDGDEEECGQTFWPVLILAVIFIPVTVAAAVAFVIEKKRAPNEWKSVAQTEQDHQVEKPATEENPVV